MPRSRSSTATMTSSSHATSRPSSLSQAEARSRNNGHDSDETHPDDSHDSHDSLDNDDGDDGSAISVPVETLVEHLLAARRALGTISQVLRGNELATQAHQLHAETVVLAAQTAFLRQGIRDQVDVLVRMRSGMGRAYEVGRREFRRLIRTLDAANGQLEHTMAILRATTVAAIFRPEGEDPRNLLDFVDESGVAALQNAIKESIAELQAAQTSFDGDLLRFDTDLRTLNKTMAAAPTTPPPLPLLVTAEDTDGQQGSGPTMPHLLASLTTRSHAMAENLSSLTRHFDMCVKAVQTTEGKSALERWQAAQSQEGAEETEEGDSGHGNHDNHPVSISGVIAEQEAASGQGGLTNLEPISAQERADILQVVMQDAGEVDYAVGDTANELHAAEAEFAAVRAHHEQTAAAFAATAATLRVLDDVGGRLPSYAAAETEFSERWAHEQAAVADRLADMDELRAFYEGYANAYDTLILEAERRRNVEAKIQAVWRKARDAVDRLVVADAAERESFRHDVGEYLPTDLWADMDRPPRGHDLFSAAAAAAAAAAAVAATTTAAVGSNKTMDGTDESGPDPSTSSNGPGGSSTRTDRQVEDWLSVMLVVSQSQHVDSRAAAIGLETTRLPFRTAPSAGKDLDDISPNMNMLLDTVGLGHAASASSSCALPRYVPLDSKPAGRRLSIDDAENNDGSSASHAVRHRHSCRPRQRAASAAAAAAAALPSASKARLIPSSRRFWADFTLGFADGLTVPFALTAGLSSLGQTDTVLSAGLAEISAGCISMGIGGYLSARQTSSEPEPVFPDGEETDEKSPRRREDEHLATTVAHRYLEPLGLPLELQQLVLNHIADQPHVTDRLVATALDQDDDEDDDNDNDDGDLVWPVSAGLSVAGGYLVGGMLPLGPYFFVTSVGDGLRWSFAVCILALFLFGFVRDFCLSGTGETARQPAIPWRRLWKSTCEGLQMVVLGGIAAIAAVLCVRLLEDAKSGQDSS
ncbi:kinase activator protein [Grosmannia clavigera kw1407]|uniref:Autophagy-related protein 17 n=1 Tax=Grosmannia clavigera (strain kw1407 / UAMH 11150) TaxID=655863 RepID=F0XNK1_GROCL|nr:kinase activator protein [Grosmannia clavigera kw1407]EFX00065.1 kinase activator protein [Grosmannia clavigera kw1407]